MATTTEKPSIKLDPKYDNYDFPTVAPTKRDGHPGFTTPEQDAAVHQLRLKLEAAGYTERLDTLTMLRFLRARKFIVPQSEQMFIECEKWRKDFGLDELIRNFDYKEKNQIFEYYPQYYHGTDKDGRPVYIEQLGKIDLAAINRITTTDRMLQNLAVEYEKMADPRLPACSRKAGYLLETSCSIIDMKGVGISRAGSVYGYIKQTSALSQNYYPERLGKMYLINTPWGFSTVYGIVKKWLDPVTVEKIHVCGSGYINDLLAQVPAENLPKHLGGKCECEGGCIFSDKGPWQDPQWARPPKWQQEAEKKAKAGSETQHASNIHAHDIATDQKVPGQTVLSENGLEDGVKDMQLGSSATETGAEPVSGAGAAETIAKGAAA